jgi:hypothetical protein
VWDLYDHHINNFTSSRGERVNDGHLRALKDKTKNICKVEILYKLAFSMKGLLLKNVV